MLSLLIHEILSRRNAIIGWSVGLALFGLMYTAIYPEMQDQVAALADLSIYEAMGVEVATFEGYLASSVIGFIPILLGVYAILTATATLAGEEDNGTLELLLTTRMKRWQIVTAKAVALVDVIVIILIAAGLGTMMAFTIIQDQIATDIAPGQVFGVVFSTLPLILALMMLGLFLGALLPSRRMAMTVGLIFLVISYFAENMGAMLDSLDFLKPFSLFSYFDSRSTAFTDGVAFGDIAVLLIFALLCFIGAVVAFQRRDVTVGNWPWQRVRLN